MRTIFIHPERCIGCKHCEVACRLTHSKTKNLLDLPTDKTAHKRIFVETTINYLTMPIRCRHCNPALCEQTCPTGAIYRDTKIDAVLVDTSRCIGCAMCAIVCPFDVISFYKDYTFNKEVNIKCDFCIDRLSDNQIPACVDACKTNALEFGDINQSINQSRHKALLDLSKILVNEEGKSIPDNIIEFRRIMQKVYQLGAIS